MMDALIGTLIVGGLTVWAVVAFIKAILRGFRGEPSHSISPPIRFQDAPTDTSERRASTRTPFVLKIPPSDGTTDLVRMTKPSKRAFTNADELHAATARQRLWIRYEDYNGNESEREVDVYCPRSDDPYIFTWCHLKDEPRTFKRENISAWQFLDGRYTVNPLVEKFWSEEGGRNPKDTIPWKRWLELKGRA